MLDKKDTENAITNVTKWYITKKWTIKNTYFMAEIACKRALKSHFLSFYIVYIVYIFLTTFHGL